MMSAPRARTAAACTPLIVACVPTGMKAGVRTVPCAELISPRRAAPSVAISVKPKSCAIRGLMVSGREAYHGIRRRKALRLYPGDCFLYRLAEGRHHPCALQDVEPLFRREPADCLLDFERLRHVRVQFLGHRDVDARRKQQRHRINGRIFMNHRYSPPCSAMPPE